MPDDDRPDAPAQSFDFQPSIGERQRRRASKQGNLLSLLGGFKGIFLVVFAIVFYFVYNAWRDSLERNKQERMEQLRQQEPVEPWFGK